MLFDLTTKSLQRHVKLCFSNTLIRFWQQIKGLRSCCLFLMRRCILCATRAASVSQMRKSSSRCLPNIWSIERLCLSCQRKIHGWTGRRMAKTQRMHSLLINCLARRRRRREKQPRMKKQRINRKRKMNQKQPRRQPLMLLSL